MRPSRRAPDELRAVSLERGVVKYAEGSCMVKFGDTHVLVTATLEERLPPWLKGQGRGWVTAEYGMLPRATLERTRHGGRRSSSVAVTSTWVSPNFTRQEPSAYFTTPRSRVTARNSSGARRLGRMGNLRELEGMAGRL